MQQPCGQGTKQSSSGLLAEDWQAKQEKQSLSLQTTINKETTLEFAAIRCYPLLRRRRFRQPAQTSPARTNHLSQRHVLPSHTSGRRQVAPSRPLAAPRRPQVDPDWTPGRPKSTPGRPWSTPTGAQASTHRSLVATHRPPVASNRPRMATIRPLIDQ